ncbi:hypothetical protein F5879DRAFT_934333 [Lentinula edodes]|uniref:uncharacterized protein n=1 Tax=Lentinula edodes TaxID=5353 RepID=UPI001BFB8169|nr:uncharacterized protein C8R40DRAFT_1107776 [Lentinula edodes]KAF8829163.1 hypothetical protein HHX47_DHR3001135 [Lentinula edodes]KAH7874727.1 hypothetical protein C8R40DRAFT_1107776 [Lentinula edodes]KAJ3909165.1 hypothetical protein F5879DRAFT_934333 [Lentinula edodes]
MKELRSDYPASLHSGSRRARPLFRTQDSEQPVSSTDPPVLPKHRSASQPPPRKPTATSGPWQHMANTYAWVVEQEFVQVDRKNRTTEQWIFEQKIRSPDVGTQERRNIEERVRRRMWEEAMNEYEIEAERWMRHEEEMRRRRVAAERERERQRAKAKTGSNLQDELRRFEFEARMRDKQERDREAEKHREDRYRARQAAREREREHRERVRAEREKSIVNVWEKYEKQWVSLISTSSEPIKFSDIPWPVQHTVTSPEDLTPTGISAFLLSALHSQNQSRKERIRNAQLRWHPDRFQRVMRRVREEDKGSVAEGVGIVARCLNDMMTREKRA